MRSTHQIPADSIQLLSLTMPADVLVSDARRCMTRFLIYKLPAASRTILINSMKLQASFE